MHIIVNKALRHYAPQSGARVNADIVRTFC